jgi:hypothetical protein
VNTAGGLVSKATTDATILAGGAGLGAYSLASKTLNMTGKGVSGAAGLAKDTVTGAVGLAKDTVGGAVGLAKDTVGGTVGLLKSAGTGVKDILTPGQGQGQGQGQVQGQYGGQGQGQYGGGQGQGQGPYMNSQVSARYNTAPGADPYSYYGALPSKGQSNYIPITADFSAFSK